MKGVVRMLQVWSRAKLVHEPRVGSGKQRAGRKKVGSRNCHLKSRNKGFLQKIEF
jgi:hypothetical protein